MEPSTKEQCYHCGLPLIKGQLWSTVVLGQERQMCCPGCQAVSHSIVENGLEDYYRFRTAFADKGDELLDKTIEALDAFDHPDIQKEFVVEDGTEKHIQVTIEGISCAACGWIIEKQLLKLSGIQRVAVNVSARRATIAWQESQIKLSQIIGQLEKIGYHSLPFQPDQHEASFQKENHNFLKRIGLAGLMSMQVMMLAIGLYFGIFGSIDESTKHYLHWVSLVLSTPVVFYSGFEFYRSAFNALKVRSINMDFSVTLAVLGTYLASVWATVTKSGEIYFESVCMFIFLLLISRYIEHRARYKASQISANMLKYIPLTATLLENGKPQTVLAKHLVAEQIILIKPGETLPVDGEILDGDSHIDESMLTGESERIHKHIGDGVYGGTINTEGTLKIKVTSEFKNALVNQILRLQELALATKPKAAIYADKASRYFILIVLFITAVSYLVWLNLDPSRAFWIAIAILVATCPCALSLATPSALTSAMAKLNEYGLLLKRADVLDQVPEIDTIVFDKTGTLTQGEYSIAEMKLFNQFSKQQALSFAASLEAYSEHPIAKAFESDTKFAMQNVVSESGLGVRGFLASDELRIGKVTFLTPSSEVDELIDSSAIYLQQNDQLVASFVLNDTIRADASSLVAAHQDKDVVMLSGDAKENAVRVAKQVGIENIHFRQTPQQKLAFVQQKQSEGKNVMVVGDGINDAPVMAAANVSVAVGNAADMSKRSADIILLNQKIGHIQHVFTMATKVRRKVKQNMAWALGYNLLILPLAIAGYLTPWMAVIGMSLSSIIVVVNSVRLLR